MAEKKFFNSNDARTLINTYGFALFPVQGFVGGRCLCGDPNCISPGKHPATKDGFKSATKDIERLKELWAGRKELNVGVATGGPSGVFVIDIDDAEGEQNLKDLGDLPPTLTAKTGKGRHLYFKYPNERVITKRGILPKVDVRGDGGYVCGVGTNHYSGAVYEWVNPLEEIAEAPQFILDMVLESKKAKHIPVPLNIKKASLNLANDNEWTEDKAYELLSFIDPDLGYDEWIAVGMAIHSEGFPFSVWDNWSRSGSKYDARGMESHWKSFGRRQGVSFGTVVYMAKQGGWQAKKPDYILPPVVTIGEAFDPVTGEIKDESIAEAMPNDGLPIVYADDVSPILDTQDFVEGLLCDNQFSVVYGESNCGKTFFMFDLAGHVALGKEWRGRAVEQGAVIYCALEGGHGTRNRLCAFKEHHGVDIMPLAIIPSSVNFLDPQGDILSLVAAIAKAQARIGNVKLIVVDTLSRAMAGGDENSSVEMGQLVQSADYIRAVTGAHIAFVHHSGKDAARGARGHSSLRAAVDTEIEISRMDTESPSKVKIVKQREMEMIEDMAFSLKRVVLGENKRGKEITSCIVIPSEVVENQKVEKLNPIQTFVYEAIMEAMITYGRPRSVLPGLPPFNSIDYDELRVVMESRGGKEFFATEKKTTSEQIKSATFSARAALKKKGKINMSDGFIWLV